MSPGLAVVTPSRCDVPLDLMSPGLAVMSPSRSDVPWFGGGDSLSMRVFFWGETRTRTLVALKHELDVTLLRNTYTHEQLHSPAHKHEQLH
jgi:hypothetical protein